MSQRYVAMKGISKRHHFRVCKELVEGKQVIMCEMWESIRKENLTSKKFCLSKAPPTKRRRGEEVPEMLDKPQLMFVPGLNAQRKKYLVSKVAEHVMEEFRERILCIREWLKFNSGKFLQFLFVFFLLAFFLIFYEFIKLSSVFNNNSNLYSIIKTCKKVFSIRTFL